ncbi:MAG: hypothetical protein R2709_06480 [Marmoricola sp.]
MARAANKRQGAQTDEKGRRKNAAKRARALADRKADSMPVAPTMTEPQLERVVDAELVSPSPKGGLKEVLANLYLLGLITKRFLAAQYAASILGLMWSYVQPALRFLTYFMLMSLLRVHDGMPNFALHLFVGMVAVHYFSETWGGATRSIWQNRPLVLKMRVPRETFPVAAMIVAAVHTFPQVVILTDCRYLGGLEARLRCLRLWGAWSLAPDGLLCGTGIVVLCAQCDVQATSKISSRP